MWASKEILRLYSLFQSKLTSYLAVYPQSPQQNKYCQISNNINKYKAIIEIVAQTEVYVGKTWKDALEDKSYSKLPTTDELTDKFKSDNLMGRFKLWRLGKPNPDLQKVFTALDGFNNYLNSLNDQIGPTILNMNFQVQSFQDKINQIEIEANNYIIKHKEGKKTPDIENLIDLVVKTRAKLLLIEQKPLQYIGDKWSEFFPLSIAQAVIS